MPERFQMLYNSHMFENDYMKAEKIYFTDQLLRRLLLWIIPKKIKPNHITVLRFILTPIVVGLIWQEHYKVGIIAFLMVSFTDAIDGALARTRDQITKWGMLYDPLADKLLITTILFVLVFKFLSFHIAIIIISLELIIILWAFWQKRKGITLQADIWGKCKMIAQVAGISMLLLGTIFSFELLILISTFVFYLAIGFALASMATHTI